MHRWLGRGYFSRERITKNSNFWSFTVVYLSLREKVAWGVILSLYPHQTSWKNVGLTTVGIEPMIFDMLARALNINSQSSTTNNMATFLQKP